MDSSADLPGRRVRRPVLYRPGAVMMEAVPQRYNYSVVWWEYIYAYQYGALAKTVLLGDCH